MIEVDQDLVEVRSKDVVPKVQGDQGKTKGEVVLTK